MIEQQALDSLASRVRDAYRDKNGLAGQYGYLYRYIKRTSGTPAGEILNSAFMAHIGKRDDVAVSMMPSFFNVSSDASKGLISAPEVRDMLGIGHKAYVILRGGRVWRERLKVVGTSRRGVPPYRPSDVQALASRLNDFVSFRQADLMLGFSQDKTRELIAAGILHQSPDVMKNKIGRASIERVQVKDLIDAIRGHATASAPEVAMSFKELHRCATRRLTVGFPALIRSLLAQQLRGHVAFPDRSDLNAIVFEAAEAIVLLDRLGSTVRSGKMQLSEVARKLRLGPKAVRELTVLGLLPEPERWASCALYDANAVTAFWEEFTYDITLGHAFGLRTALTRTRLAERGIRPVATVTLRRGQTAAVYRKTDVNGLAWLPRIPVVRR